MGRVVDSTGSGLDGGEEVADQFIRAWEIVRHQFHGASETVPMIVSLRPRDAVCVVKPQQSRTLHIKVKAYSGRAASRR
jgi:hypothetical protein